MSFPTPKIPVQTSTLSAGIKLLSPRSYGSNFFELTASLYVYAVSIHMGRRQRLGAGSPVSHAACESNEKEIRKDKDLQIERRAKKTDSSFRNRGRLIVCS